jgi:hypothetical protein
MRPDKPSLQPPVSVNRQASHGERLWPGGVRCPGLTSSFEEIHSLAAELPKRLAVFTYKQLDSCLWVVFTGGTGTGKSTVFNAFCGSELSETGVERPKTCGPIAYAHQRCSLEKGFPFPYVELERQGPGDSRSIPATGSPGHVLVLEHDRADWSHLVAVDTPDLDSVATRNRHIAQDLCLLADAVVFVTSQEKYADDVPYQFLVRLVEEEKPCFFLLNKVQEPLSDQDVLGTLGTQGLAFETDRMWLLPYAPADPTTELSRHPAFRDFLDHLFGELPAEAVAEFRQRQEAGRAADLANRLGRLLGLLEEEDRAARVWLSRLDEVYRETSRELLSQQKEHFAEESREYLKAEIRRLFSRYDLLARPRRFVRDLLLTPFRLLGFGRERSPKTHEEALLRVREKIDLTPVQTVIERFNRLVLEKLSPADEGSPLFRSLRQPGLALGDEEIRERIWQKQDELAAWLEETFQKLARGIPKHKEWGIYSTSMLWGVLLLTFETTLGGGFTMIDAALDSALAPFLTKGAAELFAYHEIQRVARELARRYQEGLLSVLQLQRDRYRECLRFLLITDEDMASLQELHARLART